MARDAVENDPKRLRARIAELEKAKGGTADTAIQKAEEAAYARGRHDGLEEAGLAARAAAEIIERGLAALKSSRPADDKPRARTVSASSPPVPTFKPATGPVAEGVTAPQQRILDAMALLETLGLTALFKVQVAAIAGVSPNSGSFANNLGRLRTAGLIDYPQPGQVSLTTEGVRAAAYPAAPPSIGDLHNAWLGLVTGPQEKILRALIEAYPDALAKEKLAGLVGVSAGSGSFANNLGRLRTLGVIDYPGKGLARADDVLFPRSRAA